MGETAVLNLEMEVNAGGEVRASPHRDCVRCLQEIGPLYFKALGSAVISDQLASEISRFNQTYPCHTSCEDDSAKTCVRMFGPYLDSKLIEKSVASPVR